MGRNGKKPSVFSRMMRFINEHQGEVVSSADILLGKAPGRTSETAYLYKLAKLGYVEAIDDGFIKEASTKYRIVRAFPEYYNSVAFMEELREFNGLIPETGKRHFK